MVIIPTEEIVDINETRVTEIIFSANDLKKMQS